MNNVMAFSRINYNNSPGNTTNKTPQKNKTTNCVEKRQVVSDFCDDWKAMWNEVLYSELLKHPHLTFAGEY